MMVFPLSMMSDMVRGYIRLQSTSIRLMQHTAAAPCKAARDLSVCMAECGQKRTPDEQSAAVVFETGADPDRMALDIADDEGMTANKQAPEVKAEKPSFRLEAESIADYDQGCNIDAAAVTRPVPEGQGKDLSPEPDKQAPGIRRAWSYTRPPVREQDLDFVERKLHTKYAYTPQGQTPDTPSARRVVERFRELKEVEQQAR